MYNNYNQLLLNNTVFDLYGSLGTDLLLHNNLLFLHLKSQ